jgi:8-oxo-dGTP diphosphatase
LWEFPGGKLEDGEEPFLGLIRELQEELGIEVMEAGPLITVTHDYSDKAVTLDVWEVSDFEGDARGVEGQEVRWVKPKQLSQFEFPAANAAIVEAVLANLAES